MYLFLIIYIIISAICILKIITSTIYVIKNADDLVDQSITLLISLLMIISFCFLINISYKALIAEDELCTTHHHPISEQVSNKDCKALMNLQSVDTSNTHPHTNTSQSINTYIQVTCGMQSCNQCATIVTHENNISKENIHKEIEASKEENIHKEEIVSSEVPTKEEESTVIDEQLICNIPNCSHCANNFK